MALNYGRSGLPGQISLGPLASILIAPFFISAAATWFIVAQVDSWMPQLVEFRWIIASSVFVLIVSAELIGISFLLSPKCPKCGTRLMEDLLRGCFEAPVLWNRSLIPPEHVAVPTIKTKCPKCGYEVASDLRSVDLGNFRGDKFKEGQDKRQQ